MILGRNAVVWGLGASAGMAVAVAGGPLLSPILLGVNPRDPVAFVLAAVVLALVTAAATWLPSRRALVSDPATLLRQL